MKDINFFGYLMIVFVVGVAIKIYFESDAFNLKCIVSDVDGNKYCVRERAKLQLAADLLARVTEKLKKLVGYMQKKYPNRPNVKRLINNFNPKDNNQLSDLKHLFNKYPYSQTISAYYLKSIKSQGVNNFSRILSRTAILSFDRANLKNWMTTEIFFDNKKEINKDLEDKFTFLDWFDKISNESDSKIDEKLNLIETFIDKKSNLIIKEKDSEYKFKPKEHDKNDPELITETLAKILTNQKKYKKAIKAYKILSLKYPKKSSFFADHIKKIKRLEKK